MSLDDLLGPDDAEPVRGARRRLAAQTFALAVVTSALGVVLLAVLLYALVVGGTAPWDRWWADLG
ncbi:MAG: hypothetical protein JWM62_2442 [Frankiales bacterium]|nr:hypothetical protein [Frankiales bacterium]